MPHLDIKKKDLERSKFKFSIGLAKCCYISKTEQQNYLFLFFLDTSYIKIRINLIFNM